jgi:hypothetical protein
MDEAIRVAKMLKRILMSSVVVLLLTSCSGGAARCETVTNTVLGQIAEGLTVTGGGSLRDGSAVRSGDYERVWFIAAEIDGTGIEGDGEVGVWASNTDPSTTNVLDVHLIYAVNSVAQEFSDWGADADPGLSMGDDGAADAEACARG